jgi:hypothetical protein
MNTRPSFPVKKADGSTPKVVAMGEFKGKVLVACVVCGVEDGVFTLRESHLAPDEYFLEPIQIVSDTK